VTRNRNTALSGEVERYSSSARNRATLATLRQRMGHWPVYAAVTGSALATATAASASSIVAYTGPPVSVSFHGNNGGTSTGIKVGAMPANFSVTVRREDGGHAGSVFAGYQMSKLTSRGYLKELTPGQKVSSVAGNWHSGSSVKPVSEMFRRFVNSRGGSTSTGFWRTGAPGFVGFRFSTSNHHFDYGWAKVEFNVD
jgi:hypothetical protein